MFDSDTNFDTDFTACWLRYAAEWRMIQTWRLGGHLTEEEAVEAVDLLREEAGVDVACAAMAELRYRGHIAYYTQPCTARTRRQNRTY